MAADAALAGTEEERTLRALSARYRWDGSPDDATRDAAPVIWRTMSVGTWDDLLLLETVFGPERLAAVLRGATAGAMTDRAWHFWHYRLGLSTVDDPPPPLPVRAIR